LIREEESKDINKELDEIQE